MNFNDFKWLNKSKSEIIENGIKIYAPPQSDFFYNGGMEGEEGITPESLCNAPFLYKEVTGDFVMKVEVEHEFLDVYDSSSLMVYENDRLWAKACFELTDFNTHAVVSVVTNNYSDDANGCNINRNKVWLQITRVDDFFAFHYSLDSKKFDMMRFFRLSIGKTIKVGLLAQAPTGKGGDRIYRNLCIENRRVKNIRFGE